MDKKILTLMFGMVLLFLTMSFVSAESIGTFKQNEDVELYQTCSNCTYVDLTSIRYPNSSTFLTNINTTQDGSYYYYILDSNYTTETGTYTYCYEAGNDIEEVTGCLEFEVTPTGKNFGTGESIVYVILFAFLVTLFVISLNMCINTPWDKGNNPAKVNYQKYLKFLYGVLSYIFMMFIMFTGKGLTKYFLPSDTIYSFFNTFSTIMVVAIGPLLIAVTFFVAWSIASDKRNANALKRNLPQEVRR